MSARGGFCEVCGAYHEELGGRHELKCMRERRASQRHSHSQDRWKGLTDAERAAAQAQHDAIYKIPRWETWVVNTIDAAHYVVIGLLCAAMLAALAAGAVGAALYVVVMVGMTVLDAAVTVLDALGWSGS